MSAVPRSARTTAAVRAIAIVAMAVALAACGLVRSAPSRVSGGSARSGGTTTRPAGRAGEAPSGAAKVTRVVDGDTIAVSIAGKTEKVRLIGIDTPESVKPGTPVQCFALEASDHTKHLLPAGTSVRLERDVDGRDQYGRLLAYDYRQQDGLFVNLALVRDGFAVQDTIPPNVAHVDDFTRAAAGARQAGRGLWSRCGDDIPVHRSAPLPSPP
jgi:micrococcal nuclease